MTAITASFLGNTAMGSSVGVSVSKVDEKMEGSSDKKNYGLNPLFLPATTDTILQLRSFFPKRSDGCSETTVAHKKTTTVADTDNHHHESDGIVVIGQVESLSNRSSPDLRRAYGAAQSSTDSAVAYLLGRSSRVLDYDEEDDGSVG